MFTGIIQKLGTVQSIETSADSGRIRISTQAWERLIGWMMVGRFQLQIVGRRVISSTLCW